VRRGKWREFPDDFSFGELPPDWEAHDALSRARHVARADHRGSRHEKVVLWSGELYAGFAPPSGEAPELKGYFVAAGLNSVGVLTGGGLGRVLANWIVTGNPDVDVTGFNIDRLHAYQANPDYRRQRTVESSAWFTNATTRRCR